MNRSSLDRSLMHGIAWTSIVTWLSQLLTWGATLYVMKHLAPDDYGLMGMAAPYFGLVKLLSDFGLGAAVLRYQTLPEDQVAQFNSLSVLTGVGSVAITALLAIPVARLFGEPRLAFVIFIMSTVYLISAFRVIPQSLMQRSFQFKAMAVYDGIQSLTMAASSMIMARMGFGYWTLVISPIIGAVLGTVLTLMHTSAAFKRPRLAVIREPLMFSGHMLTSRIAWYGFSNADFFVIGKFLGTEALGVYYIGWYISGVAVEKVTALIGRVTPSFFSAVQSNHAELRRYLRLVTEGLALITFPACIGIALVAADIVHAILGLKWEAAIMPIRLLAIVATYRSVQPLFPQILAAIGEARRNMNNTLMTVAILPFGFYAATQWGPTGVAVAWVVLGPLLFIPLFVDTLHLIGMRAREYFSALWPATSACAMMAAAVLLVDRVALHSAPPLAALTVKILVGALAYSGTLLGFHRQRIFMLREVVRNLRATPHATPAVDSP